MQKTPFPSEENNSENKWLKWSLISIDHKIVFKMLFFILFKNWLNFLSIKKPKLSITTLFFTTKKI